MSTIKHEPDCACLRDYTDTVTGDYVRPACTCSASTIKFMPVTCPVDGEALRPRCVHVPCIHHSPGKVTCGLCKPTPPAPTEANCSACEHEHKLCGPPPCNYTPKQPTADEVREARHKIAWICDVRKFATIAPAVRIVLAALDRAQGEVQNLKEGHYAVALRRGIRWHVARYDESQLSLWEAERERDALRAENARLVEEVERYRDLYAGERKSSRLITKRASERITALEAARAAVEV